jgi:hypothetical protein
MSAAATHDPTHAYRREARKLRGRFADRPAELYRSLRQLADQHDIIRGFAAPRRAPVSPTSEFASEVREFLRGGMLTYSERQNLLKSAEMRDIPRFEANLIIAAMQYRVPKGREEKVTRPSSRLPLILGFIASQIALLAAAWMIAGR